MDDDENSALEFLNSVGVWLAVNDMRGTLEIEDPRIRAMRFQGTFGHRYMNGRASVMSVEYLAAERKYWREMCRDRAKLRAAFGSASPDGADMFTLMSNTLPVHLEWAGKHPLAIIQPITGTELLTALAWMDLIEEREGKTCQNPNCGIEYTGGGSKFCDALCERANTKRNSRRRAKQAEAIIRTNPNLPIRILLEKLAEAGIKRKRDWVVKAKTRTQLVGGESKSAKI
jgi:hypothetical protein